MKDLKIIKYSYPFTTEMLGEVLWDKMNMEESKWAVQLTMKGISDTGEHESSSWDVILVDDKMSEKIEIILKKYEIPFETEDQTQKLIDNPDEFSKEFIKKLNEYLRKKLTVDQVLDTIIDSGFENLSVLEKYFLDNNVEEEK